MSTFHPQAARRPHAVSEGQARARNRRSCVARTAIVLAAATALGVGLAGCGGGGSPATYSVGGSIAGLTTAGLVLANGADTMSPAAGATSFAFATALTAGSSYAVTVQTQPANATCVVTSGSGTVAAAAVTSVAVTCTPLAFTVGGSITGLAAAGLVLANGADIVAIASGAAGFTLPTAVLQGASYTVTVQTQPTGEHCSLMNSTGTVAGANVTNVAVTCAVVSHSLGGTISGLPSAGLVLANGSDTVSPAAGALAFTFATPVAEGGAYAVTVQTQPTGATCSVGSGTGTMGTSNVVSVQVTCAANAYHLSGTITGLTAAGLVLANGGDTVSPAANATAFAFAQPVAYLGSYTVTVQQQPAGLSCAVAGVFPATMGAADVTNIAVSCAPAGGLSVFSGQLACPDSGPYPDGPPGVALVPGVVSIGHDSAGNLYVGGSGAVRKISPAGFVTTLAGLLGTPGALDGTGAAARFANPNGLAIDQLGNLLTSDGARIRQITPGDVVTTIAGSLSLGGYLDGTGPAARFGGAGGAALDTSGNLYVADFSNNVIRKVAPGGVVTTFAGSTTAGDVDATGGAARFNGPVDVAIDAAGSLYVSDTGNHAIRKVTPGGVVSTLAGGGPAAPGFLDGTGNAARFFTPERLALGTGGNLYVSDQPYSAAAYANGQALRIVDTATGKVTTLAADSSFQSDHGVPVPASATVVLPYQAVIGGIGTNAQGALFIAIGCSVQQVIP